MKVKLDENITYLAVDLLTAAGHDVHTVQMEGLAGHPDSVVWSACLAEKRVLITFDVGFGDLRLYPPSGHVGVVVLRLVDQQPGAVLDVLRRLWQITRWTHLPASWRSSPRHASAFAAVSQ